MPDPALARRHLEFGGQLPHPFAHDAHVLGLLGHLARARPDLADGPVGTAVVEE
jgi:hypothetical protein